MIIAFIDKFVRELPDGFSSVRLRLYVWRGGKIAKTVKFFEGSTLHQPELIQIGERSEIGRNCTIDPYPGKIKIGNDVLMAQGCYLRAGNHLFSNSNQLIREQGHAGGDIVIENNVWLGVNVVVLAGVVIGEGSVIGAGAVITKSIPANSVAVGVPAKVIASRQ